MIIAAISVVVSYVGDVLGMKIGKKRISIFGLRPKYTSTVITVFTGLAVAILTLLVASYTSEPVRRAFFGVNYLDRRIAQLTTDLRDRQYQLDEMELEVYGARRELERLTAEAAALKEGLEQMKEGRVVAFQGELLAQTSIEGDANADEIDAAISRLVRTAEEKLSLGDDPGEPPRPRPAAEVVVTLEERTSVERRLRDSDTRKVLRLSAPSNIVLGQTVEGVVRVYDSKLIYRRDTLLLTHTVDGALSPEDAADLLYALLKQINRIAVGNGVLPDPISGAVGNLDSMEFYDAVDMIVGGSGERKIDLFAAADIYTEGPVNIRVKVSSGDAPRRN
jgi:uncharacterized protein (DUF3084 family)